MFGAFRQPIVSFRTVERKTRVFKGQPCIQGRIRKLRGDDGSIAGIEASDMQMRLLPMIGQLAAIAADYS